MGTGLTLWADGSGAVITDNSVSVNQTPNTQTTYEVSGGGFVELANNTALNSVRLFDGDDGTQGGDGGTFALPVLTPGIITAQLADIGWGLSLELPGAEGSVTNVGFSLFGLSITTSAGTFNFDSVYYYDTNSAPGGYTIGYDSALQLDIITLAPNYFSQSDADGNGNYNWSDLANWSNGIPFADAGVWVSGSGIDDVANLSLATLDLAGSNTTVTGSLTVEVLDGANAVLTAHGTSANITIGETGSIGNGPETLIADGGVINDQAITYSDFGQYTVTDGGKIVVATPTLSASTFTYNGVGTIGFSGITLPAVTRVARAMASLMPR